MEKQEGHKPVLLEECLQNLNLFPGQWIVDGTLGGGGHSEEILKKILPGGKLIGVDKDEEAIERCKTRFQGAGEDILYLHGDFKELPQLLAQAGIETVNGILIDLGVSSFQLEDAARGFSYGQTAVLDMRMDKTSPLTACDVVNEYSRMELTRIFRDYGEEKWASRIAEFIERARANKKIETTDELTQIIKNAIPASARRQGPHPSKRTFQAIRIEVNGELAGLGHAVDEFTDLLAPGGRLCVITFHSLEDRIIKQTMRKLENPCECPPKAPICTCGKKPVAKVITRKPIVPGAEELEGNPRARSAKLRVLEKL
ncbi:MAG: 16S rRNA (cytosine(1402)-N(4))-methyltransferase RsmH [Eubacteriales bacterium]